MNNEFEFEFYIDAKEFTPEHDKRRNKDDTDIETAYEYVVSVKETSDIKNKDEYLWHGWALREAFLAGMSHEKKKHENI
jgi:hypothetical protein